MARKKSATKVHEHFHKDGSLWARGELQGGVMEGYWEWFRKDGSLMRTGSFSHGVQVDEWKTYRKDGSIVKVTTMKPKQTRYRIRCRDLRHLRIRAGGEIRKRKMKLSTSMTLSQFDNGYWYATQLKDFGDAIGIPSANKLRKDELEKAIRSFLKTGKVTNPSRRTMSIIGIKDVERGLSLELEVVRFTNDVETKSFLERESQKLIPGLKRKSGVRYRFNRWREDQLANGVRLTYRDLVGEYVRLNQTTQPFEQIPIDCYINFLSDFFAAEKGATREQAMKAWRKLKSLDAPKNYRAWSHVQSSKSK